MSSAVAGWRLVTVTEAQSLAVYSGSSVTSVLGGVGEVVEPMCHKRGPEMKWVEADNKKVEELRRY